MQARIPAVLMRGGTSKGLFFHENHLPSAPAVRDRVILAAYGSPDPYRRQMNGIGGATSVSSKTAIISPSADPAYDVEYYFGQVSIDRAVVAPPLHRADDGLDGPALPVLLPAAQRPAVVYTEMITTGALLHGDVPRHLDFDPREHPVALPARGQRA